MENAPSTGERARYMAGARKLSNSSSVTRSRCCVLVKGGSETRSGCADASACMDDSPYSQMCSIASQSSTAETVPERDHAERMNWQLIESFSVPAPSSYTFRDTQLPSVRALDRKAAASPCACALGESIYREGYEHH